MDRLTTNIVKTPVYFQQGIYTRRFMMQYIYKHKAVECLTLEERVMSKNSLYLHALL